MKSQDCHSRKMWRLNLIIIGFTCLAIWKRRNKEKKLDDEVLCWRREVKLIKLRIFQWASIKGIVRKVLSQFWFSSFEFTLLCYNKIIFVCTLHGLNYSCLLNTQITIHTQFNNTHSAI